MSDYDSRNPISERERMAKDRKRKEAEERADLSWLMSTKRGRGIVWRIIESCGVYETTFNTNALTMAFSEGKRVYAMSILQDVINMSPDLYSIMLKECQKQ